jgi:ABC-type nitrate/sulfonate/bicarbonate transport system permease component
VAEASAPRPAPWWRTLRADPPFLMRMVIGAGFLAVVFALWWAVTYGKAPLPCRFIDFDLREKAHIQSAKCATDAFVAAGKIPSPGAVFSSMDELLDRELDEHIWATLIRVFKGVGYAALWGILLGVLAASYRAVGAALNPLVIFLRSIPMGALFPLIVVLASGETNKVLFIFLAIVPFVFSDVFKAVSTVPERYVETAQTLGATRFQIIRKVLFPLALPDIITSIRIQFGLALGYIMLAEVNDANKGIGFMLDVGRRRGLLEQNYLLLFVLALMAFMIDFVLRELQRNAFRYRTDL